MIYLLLIVVAVEVIVISYIHNNKKLTEKWNKIQDVLPMVNIEEPNVSIDVIVVTEDGSFHIAKHVREGFWWQANVRRRIPGVIAWHYIPIFKELGE